MLVHSLAIPVQLGAPKTQPQSEYSYVQGKIDCAKDMVNEICDAGRSTYAQSTLPESALKR